MCSESESQKQTGMLHTGRGLFEYTTVTFSSLAEEHHENPSSGLAVTRWGTRTGNPQEFEATPITRSPASRYAANSVFCYCP